MPTREWMRGLPKAEIHVHLEGCLSPAVLEGAAARAGQADALTELRAFSDLAGLLDFLDWSCALIDTAELVSRVAYDAAAFFADSGTRYVDLIFNPAHWPAWTDRLDGFIAALDRGFHAAEVDGHPPVALCASIGRHQSAAEAVALVEWAAAVGSSRIVGISVDGNEAIAGRTGPRFAEAFERAAARGLRRAVHAGESSGPEGVHDACELLRAERIDHGIRAAEDPELVARLAALGVPLGICPTSNVALGLVAEIGEHPLENLRRAGVSVTINTDDPLLFDTDLVSEYAACARAFAWDEDDVRELAAASIRGSFAPDDLKARLLAELDDYASPPTSANARSSRGTSGPMGA